MKLISIELHNIGLYHNQTILFPYSGKEAVIFWGNNGAGKTTLLSSIKVGLLGQKAISGDFGKYCEFVSSNLISSRWDKTTGNASIRIAFEIVEQNEKRIVSLLRSWSFISGSLSEDVSFFFKGQKLDFIQAERIQNKIFSILPPALMEVLIFDGENAISLLQKDRMPELIRNIVYSIFGMNVYSRATKDLTSCLKHVAVNQESHDEELRVVELGSAYRQAIATNKSYKSILADRVSMRKTKMSNLNVVIRRLSQKTGVSFGDIESLKTDVVGLQDNQKKLHAEIKYVTEEILPLKLLQSRIKTLIDISERERPYQLLRSLETIEAFFKDDKSALSIISDLEKKIPTIDSREDIVGLEEKDVKLFKQIIAILEEYPKAKIFSYMEQKSGIYASIKESVESLEKLNDPDSKQLLAQVESLSAGIDSLDEEISRLQAQIGESDVSLEELKKQYEECKKVVSDMKKSSNAYLQISLYRDALEQFVETKVADICQSLNKSLRNELGRIGYRNGSIEAIEINPKTFAISVYEKGRRPIPFSVFSAGEKQILLGLIIKESLRMSGMDGFFLFDTPVGRLDMSNRAIFTNEVIFEVADQVLVFATDSDYSQKDYEGIKNRLTGEKMLARSSDDWIVVRTGSIYSGGAK